MGTRQGSLPEESSDLPLAEAAAAALDQAEAEAPVYDERGNVRPRGTKGARPMTYAERVEIAQRIAAETA